MSTCSMRCGRGRAGSWARAWSPRSCSTRSGSCRGARRCSRSAPSGLTRPGSCGRATPNPTDTFCAFPTARAVDGKPAGRGRRVPGRADRRGTVTAPVLERPATTDTAPSRGRRLHRAATWAAVGIATAYAVLPQLTGSSAAWRQLSGVQARWLWAALALEVASLAAYAALTRALLPRPGRPSFRHLLAIDLATMGISHVVPAGSAVGLGLGYRLLTAAGVRGPAAVSTKAVQAVGSAVVLNLLLWVALIVSVAQNGAGSGYGLVAVLGAVLMAGVALLLVLLLRGGKRVAAAVARTLARLP